MCRFRDKYKIQTLVYLFKAGAGNGIQIDTNASSTAAIVHKSICRDEAATVSLEKCLRFGFRIYLLGQVKEDLELYICVSFTEYLTKLDFPLASALYR